METETETETATQTEESGRKGWRGCNEVEPPTPPFIQLNLGAHSK